MNLLPVNERVFSVKKKCSIFFNEFIKSKYMSFSVYLNYIHSIESMYMYFKCVTTMQFMYK